MTLRGPSEMTTEGRYFASIIIIIIIILVSPTRVCVVYVVKEVTSFPGARSINGRGA